MNTLYHGPDIHVILALVGATIIITRGTIFKGLQRSRLGGFFTCSLCVGFWIGAVSLFVLRHGAGSYAGHSLTWWAVADFFLDGASVALLSLAADAVLLKLLGDPEDK